MGRMAPGDRLRLRPGRRGRQPPGRRGRAWRASRIRLLDENGDLWVSANRGASWTQAQSPLKVPVFESLTAPRAAMRFTAAGDGVLAVIADEGGPKGHVYRTRDGGKTWAEEVVPGLPASVLTVSTDAKLLTSFDQYTIRLYRAD